MIKIFCTQCNAYALKELGYEGNFADNSYVSGTCIDCANKGLNFHSKHYTKESVKDGVFKPLLLNREQLKLWEKY